MSLCRKCLTPFNCESCPKGCLCIYQFPPLNPERVPSDDDSVNSKRTCREYTIQESEDQERSYSPLFRQLANDRPYPAWCITCSERVIDNPKDEVECWLCINKRIKNAPTRRFNIENVDTDVLFN